MNGVHCFSLVGPSAHVIPAHIRHPRTRPSCPHTPVIPASPPSFPRTREPRENQARHSHPLLQEGAGGRSTTRTPPSFPLNPRHSGESRRFSGRNVHPEGKGNGEPPANWPRFHHRRGYADLPFAQRKGTRSAANAGDAREGWGALRQSNTHPDRANSTAPNRVMTY